MKNSSGIIKFFGMILFFIFAFGFAYAADEKQAAEKTGDLSGISPDTALSIEKAIDLVLNNNLTLRSAKYDVIMSDSDYQRNQKKYSTNLNLEGGYFYQKSPPSGLSAFTGDKQYQWDAGLSVSKMFSSGTMLMAGVKEVLFDANDSAIAGFKEKDPPYHKPALFVNLQQELLKNSFGYNDRMMDDIKNNNTKMQRAAIINQLSGLVVGALVDYWTVTIQKSAVEISKLELETNRQVQKIIKQNAEYGLSESYDLNQYNALVAGSETKVAMAEQSYRDAVRKLLRTLNMPPETQVKGVTDLIDKLPPLDSDAGEKAAFEKRVDYKNALIALENSKNDLKMQENNSMPSLTLSLGLNTAGQSEDVVPAFRDASLAKYPALSARMKLSYPLDDREQKTNLRNAYLKVRQSQLTLDGLKLDVRDDVRSRCEQVKLQYDVLQKSRTVRAETELYHQKLFVKFKLGKVTSVTMKLGTDSMVQSRQRELESLVYYNVALLQYDLAKNEIFERYNVDVEKYIKAVKE